MGTLIGTSSALATRIGACWTLAPHTGGDGHALVHLPGRSPKTTRIGRCKGRQARGGGTPVGPCHLRALTPD
jgi:hypothetical protein